jgi:hypothetical protein
VKPSKPLLSLRRPADRWPAFSKLSQNARGTPVAKPKPVCCADCGVNTSSIDGIDEWYMVKDDVWIAARMKRSTLADGGGFLCIGCLEKRLGRQLWRPDFSDCPLSNSRFGSPRLRLRLRDTVARRFRRDACVGADHAH